MNVNLFFVSAVWKYIFMFVIIAYKVTAFVHNILFVCFSVEWSWFSGI